MRQAPSGWHRHNSEPRIWRETVTVVPGKCRTSFQMSWTAASREETATSSTVIAYVTVAAPTDGLRPAVAYAALSENSGPRGNQPATGAAQIVPLAGSPLFTCATHCASRARMAIAADALSCVVHADGD